MHTNVVAILAIFFLMGENVAGELVENTIKGITNSEVSSITSDSTEPNNYIHADVNDSNDSTINEYVALVCLGISSIGILLHLIASILVPDLQNLKGKNLVSLCLAILLAYAMFIYSMLVKKGTQECFNIAAAIYYFLMSSFCWMNVIAFNIWRTVRRSTTGLNISQEGNCQRFIIYSIYGWIVPLVFLFIVVLLDTVEPEGIHFLPSLGEKMCWFGQTNAHLIFFTAPLWVIMAINLLFFVHSYQMIKDSDQTQGQLHLLRLYMRLALLMCLTWLSGTVARFVEKEISEIIWYIFILLNTLQGVLIFFTFTCKRSVWEVIRVKCLPKIGSSHSVSDLKLTDNSIIKNKNGDVKHNSNGIV